MRNPGHIHQEALMGDSTMTPSAAARVLGLSKTHVLRLVDSGQIDAVRTPLGRLLDTASVERLAAERHEVAAA
jgi:excisionase family DNA binding protein